jgi:hypothetical protein
MMSTTIESLGGQRARDPAGRVASPAAVPPGPAAAPPTVAAAAAPVKPEPSWGAWVVIAGLVSVVAIFVVAVLHYKTAAEVTTAVGAVSGVIAALVGAYFGIRGATLAQTKVESSNAAREQRPGN